MSLLSEIREDVRLARLNNPGYSALFRLMDVAIGLFKLLVLAVVGLGLWHLIYDISVADSKKNLRQLADALKTPADAIVESTPDYTELTPERIEMLRQFAKNNRNSDADTSEGSLTAATSIDAASSDSATLIQFQGRTPLLIKAMTWRSKRHQFKVNPLLKSRVTGCLKPLRRSYFRQCRLVMVLPRPLRKSSVVMSNL